MGKKWVRALNTCRVVEGGEAVTYYAGDIFSVHGMAFRQLTATQQAEPIGITAAQTMAENYDLTDCGIVLTLGGASLPGDHYGLDVARGYELAFSRSLLWDGKVHLRLDLLPVGFHRLTRGWQIAAPLWKYQQLARDIGTQEARARTEEVIHDLRVPVYETGLMYIRRCTQNRRLIWLWREDCKATGDDEKLCFMRALYQVKPTMCALPTSWTA